MLQTNGFRAQRRMHRARGVERSSRTNPLGAPRSPEASTPCELRRKPAAAFSHLSRILFRTKAVWSSSHESDVSFKSGLVETYAEPPRIVEFVPNKTRVSQKWRAVPGATRGVPLLPPAFPRR